MSKVQKDALIAEIVEACADPKRHTTDCEQGTEYPQLFSACSIGGLRLKNRCVIAPLDELTELAPNERIRRFYLSRSEAGLLTTGLIPASLAKFPLPLQLWRRLNETLHARGTKILLQLQLKNSDPASLAYLASAGQAWLFDGVCLYAREDDEKLLDSVRAIRTRLGADYPILCRVSLSAALAESGLTPSGRSVRSLYDSFSLMTELVKAGADAFEVGLGGPETPWLLQPASQMPAACFAEAARALRTHFLSQGLHVPVFAFGRLSEPAVCETLLTNGDCDLISLDGAGISDADWVRKAGEGRADEICPLPLPTYSVASGHERIAVIGAGCRGLNYAIRAAQAGHSVSLYDSSSVPGGKLALYRSGASAEKERLRARLIREAEKQIGLSLRLGCRADLDLLRKGRYDRVVFACPSYAVQAPSIPGWGEIPFVTANAPGEAFSGKWRRKHVAVFGSDALACDLAWVLQSERAAKKVLLITEKPQLMPGEPENDRAWFLHHFSQRGGLAVTGCTPLRMQRHILVCRDADGKERHLLCDRVLLAEESPAPLRLYQEVLRSGFAGQVVLL